MRFLTFLIGLGLLTQAAGAAPLPAQAYMHPQRLVTLPDGRRLNLYCLGRGSPTVLFDSGLGDSTLAWRGIQGEIARTTRACTYDRAGLGFSDSPRGESDADAAVADLHALLTAAKIKTPVLYVGHSMAGLYGVLLAARYPEDVAGAVLVDPSFADQSQRMLAVVPAAVQAAALGMFQHQLDEMHACQLKPLPLPKACINTESGPQTLEKPLADFELQRISRPEYLRANASEFSAFFAMTGKSADQLQVEAAPLSFGDKPLIVLTHSRDPIPGLTPEQNAAVEQAWREGHGRLAALSSHGSNAVVPDSGHYIQFDQPQAVLDAINKAIAELRGR